MLIRPLKNLAYKAHTYSFNPKSSREPLETSTIPLNSKTNSPKKILLVEDNPINQKMIAYFLNEIGYVVDIANNGKEALALYHIDYKLIILDIGLPDIDGYTVCKLIRSLKEGKQIPIIACTAFLLSDVSQHCCEAGMDEVINKPTDVEELRLLIEKYVK